MESKGTQRLVSIPYWTLPGCSETCPKRQVSCAVFSSPGPTCQLGPQFRRRPDDARSCALQRHVAIGDEPRGANLALQVCEHRKAKGRKRSVTLRPLLSMRSFATN